MNKENQKGMMLDLLAKMQGYLPNVNQLADDLKALETYLSELSNMINIFADAIDEGVVLWQDNRIVWANRAVSEISGYTLEEILSIDLEQIQLPDYRDKYKARISMIVAGDKESMPVEWQILRKDRTVRYIAAFANMVRFLDKIAIMVIFYDITEDKKLQDEMKMRAQVLDSVSDAVLLMDVTGKIVYVNEAVSGLTGYTQDELLNMNIIKLALPERVHKIEINLKQFSEHKESRYKTIIVRKDNTSVSVEIRGKVIKQGGRQLLLGVAREIVAGMEYDTESESTGGRNRR
ncbi:MAG: PAS domain S-box protein [Dehalococcoidia bacterium]|nr:MAG: PAS domain S-box protein [Dehalococcoidia bacterium]